MKTPVEILSGAVGFTPSTFVWNVMFNGDGGAVAAARAGQAGGLNAFR